MNETSNLLMYVFFGILAIGVWALIPGLNQTIKPLLGALSNGMKLAIIATYSWLVFITKSVVKAHLDVIENLSKPAEQIDPSMAIYKGPERVGEPTKK